MARCYTPGTTVRAPRPPGYHPGDDLPAASVPPRALVTGASSGIGWAVAERLVAGGWDVTVLVRRDLAPPGARQVRGDATDPAAIAAAVAAAAPDGRLDALVCAAGVPPSGPWDDEAHWHETLAVDLTAPYDATRLAWPALREARGAVVLVGSIVGAHEGSARSPAYSAAKAGLEGLARSLAVIGGPDGIRVNVVAPGAIDTPFDPASFPPDARPDVPLGRMGTADEVAGVVTFLLSPDAAYVSGAVWGVDGARTAFSPAAAAMAGFRRAGGER
ncbi:MAG: SDR family oxidoreductase [Chloroflexota bacterium]